MKKILFITLLFIFIISCSNIYVPNPQEFERKEFSKIIVEDVHNKFSKSVFKETSIIVIIEYDSLDNGSVVYGVFDKSFVEDLTVKSDSVDIFLNNYTENENKLYVWKDKDVQMKPSDIYSKLQEYGTKLDSCYYKYDYLQKDIEKLTNCIFEKEGYWKPFPRKDIFYIVSKTDKNELVKIKRKRKLGSWYYDHMFDPND